MFKKIKWIGNNVNRDILQLLKENQSSINLKEVLPNYFPFSHFSMCVTDLEIVINSVFFGKSKKILECGSGLSTIAIAKFLKNDPDAKIISLEHDKEWIEIMNRLIEREGLTNIVIHYTPLIDFDIDSVKGKWYDISNVNLDSDFDMLVIDGPPSYKKGLLLSRYPAISLIQNKLKKDGMFYMDDFRRTGEVEVLKKWEQKIKLNPGKKNLYGKGQIYFK
jgi:predicted O-methyltransferase YrrM